MNLSTLRILTDDVDKLVEFYERILEIKFDRLHILFAQANIGSCSIAIASTKTSSLLGDGKAVGKSNNSVIFDIQVKNVDTQYKRLKNILDIELHEPKIMPWGNKSLIFRDIDGNLLNMYTVLDE